MAKGILGIDTSYVVTQAIINTATAANGVAPRFWGRYFKKANSPHDVQYDPQNENTVFNAAGIRILPIARQTNNVNGTEATGLLDGANNAEAIIAAFGVDHMAQQGSEFLVFLDVEGPPSLSLGYYTGWAKSLDEKARQISNGHFTLRPCVYARTNDNVTWTALIAADAINVKCYGAWIFRSKATACADGFVHWDNAFVAPSTPLPFPIFLWQYAIDCPHGNKKFDFDQTNPNLDGESQVMSKLILPPLA